eukprot:TRINITY_DN48775_c0_g1_i1.p2 TRINITY_DN48775_c0_g1~~TRINITY_DN48775_c0_g1_i1.p2  ORF type:complete len:130 (-),score=33.25 TRINITY_DN48775_c0_g1_i1:64-453(-)
MYFPAPRVLQPAAALAAPWRPRVWSLSLAAGAWPRRFASAAAARLNEERAGDGSRAKQRMQYQLLEFRSEPYELRDPWAWMKRWEDVVSTAKRKSKKVRRKLVYSSSCPEGLAARERQRQYWEAEARRE